MKFMEGSVRWNLWGVIGPHVFRVQLSAKPCQPRSNARTISTSALKVRPYTVRKGDTLDLIAEKRGQCLSLPQFLCSSDEHKNVKTEKIRFNCSVMLLI